MNWIYQGFKFDTDCRIYKVLVCNIESPYIKEIHGKCIIYFPESLNSNPRPTTAFQYNYFTYSGVTYRLLSLDPISVTITQIDDLGDTIVQSDNYSVKILSDHLDNSIISNALTKDGLFQQIQDNSNGKFEYKELINRTINRNFNADETTLNSKSISIEDAKNKYRLDFTHCINALYDRLKDTLNNQGFYLMNLYKTEEVDTTEVATLQFNQYPEDYYRLYPEWNNEFNQYNINCRLILNTSSISKFERLISEYKNLKYLSNIPRIYLKDMYDQTWVCPINWKPDLDTNTPSEAQNNRSEVSYYIGIDFQYSICIVRNDKYLPIRQILLAEKELREDGRLG